VRFPQRVAWCRSALRSALWCGHWPIVLSGRSSRTRRRGSTCVTLPLPASPTLMSRRGFTTPCSPPLVRRRVFWEWIQGARLSRSARFRLSYGQWRWAGHCLLRAVSAPGERALTALPDQHSVRAATFGASSTPMARYRRLLSMGPGVRSVVVVQSGPHFPAAFVEFARTAR